MDIKVSIIIPIYNTGQMLKRCIDSVVCQTLQEIEIILVDDGSTDESGSICDEYAISDRRVKVIHKKNEGVSIARNTGIKNAVGEYIGFIDSDDWIEPSMFEVMYNAAAEKAVQLVMCDAVTKYDNKPEEPDTITQLNDSRILDKLNITPLLLLEMAGSACRCIYKRQMLVENGIEFPKRLKIAEDRIFNIYAFGNADQIYYIKEAFYNRYVRMGSAVNKHYSDMLEIILKANAGVVKALNDAWNGNEEYLKAYKNQLLAHAYGAINNEFYKDADNRLSDKYKNIKRLCDTEEIRDAIETLNRHDIRARLIMNKSVVLLCMISIFLNKKHRR